LRRRFDNGQTVSGTRSRTRRDEFGILEGTDAVVDAGDVEQVERVAHIAGRAFLAGMSDGPEPERPRSFKYSPKLPRRVVSLCRVETDGDDTVTVRQRLFESRHRLLRVAVA